MPKSLVLPEVGRFLPSHLTQAQAARHLEISRGAIGHRLAAKSLPSHSILGTLMIPSMALVDPTVSTYPSAHAFRPDQIVETAWDAVALLADAPDRPMFSARQILGVYLGLSKLPYPPRTK
jgi:hypothetical protein